MTTPAETPNAKTPEGNEGCPQWLGAEPCHYVAQKSPSFPVFIRACSCCGRIDFGELARDLADAGYVVVPQPEIRRRAKDAHIACVAQRSDGHWGVYCLACSDAADDYVFPCKVRPENQYWPPPVLQAGSGSNEGETQP